MNAFWWFRENAIAGMARPGFNHRHWMEMPFEESMLFGFVGHLPGTSTTWENFRNHISTYAPKCWTYHGLGPDKGRQAIKILDTPQGVRQVFARVRDKTRVIADFSVSESQVEFKLCPDRLHAEIEFIKNHRIETVVTLTERHHEREEMAEHFETHHLAIPDLEAPTLEQVYELREILLSARERNSRVVVHCMAGIGRTSTMLLASHIAMGENFADLSSLLARQNPRFELNGPQEKFVMSLVSDSREQGRF